VGSDISSLIGAAERGDNSAAQALFSALYEELHGLAKRQLARHGAPPSLGVTTLLHEAYLGIASRGGTSFPDQARFMKYAARVMRGLIIDHFRRHQAIKRGSQFEITSPQYEAAENTAEVKEINLIGEALDDLARIEPALAEVVDLKFFCGFSFAEIASTQGVSERTVQRHWKKARIYLHRRINSNLII
jgi:RNA polymerase sigma factor (TIGR02999 family)